MLRFDGITLLLLERQTRKENFQISSWRRRYYVWNLIMWMDSPLLPRRSRVQSEECRMMRPASPNSRSMKSQIAGYKKVSWIDRMPCWVRWLLCYSRESTRKTRKLRAVGLNWLLDEREKDAAHNRIDDDVACAHQLTGRLVLPRLAPPSHSDDWFVSTYQFTT